MSRPLIGAQGGAHPPNLAAAVWLLAWVDWRTTWNDLRRSSLRRQIGRLLIALLLIGGGLGFYWLTRTVLAALTGPGRERLLERIARSAPPESLPLDLGLVVQALPALAFSMVTLMVVLTSFSDVLNHLYLAGDLDLLLAAPIPRRAVFLVKLGRAVIGSYGLLLALLAPAVLGYGQGLGYGPGYAVVAVVMLLCLPLLPISLATLLVMAVIRVLPAQRARGIIGVLGVLMGLVWYGVGQLSTRFVAGRFNRDVFDNLVMLDGLPIPPVWAGHALVAAGQGDWPTVLVAGGGFALLSLISFGLCLLLAELLYRLGWSEEATGRQRQGAPGAGRWTIERLLQRRVPAQLSAIIVKDLQAVPRDLRNLQRFIFPLGMAVIWIVQLVTTGRVARAGTPEASIVGLGTSGIVFFLCLTISTALAGPGISREGPHFWLLKVAPLTARRLLIAKLVLAYLPFPLIGTLLTLVMVLLRQLAPIEAGQVLLLLMVAGLGTTSLSLAIGASFPRLDWQNPQQQVGFGAGCLARLLYPLYLGLIIATTNGLPLLSRWLPTWSPILPLLGWGLAGALTAGIVWAALTIGAARLERLELLG